MMITATTLIERQHSEKVGSVLNVNRSQATIRLHATEAGVCPTVGNFLGVCTGSSVLIGAIISIATTSQPGDAKNLLTAQIDLLGELSSHRGGELRFSRGVMVYPSAGNVVRTLTSEELETTFSVPQAEGIVVGTLQQSPDIPARININNLLTKHFAVLGTTGVGKSSGVALILQRIAEARPALRTFMIDPHNEYGNCFGDRAEVLNPTNLKLPFWLFNFEEIVDVFFRARPGVEDEVAVLSELIPLAKAMYAAPPELMDSKILRRQEVKGGGYTVDTPVPFRLADLLSLVDERMGKLENRSSVATYTRLVARIDTVRNDRRYAFMFDNANVGGDSMVDVVSKLFQLPPAKKTMTVMQLAGFPTEVVDSVVSVVCRMAFDFGLWSDGEFPLLFICEEAHRYAPADRSIGFGPTRKAVSRIAKEGRKYGVFLGLVTQRAGELDATILSQCSTIFAMRMGNEQDQNIIRSAVSDAAANLLGFVPTLGTREVFAFGEGVALPLRFHFDELPREMLPRGQAVPHQNAGPATISDRDRIAGIIDRWRGGALAQRKTGPNTAELEQLARSELSSGRNKVDLGLQRSSDSSAYPKPELVNSERGAFGIRR